MRLDMPDSIYLLKLNSHNLPRCAARHAEHQHRGVPVSRGSLLQGQNSAAAEKYQLEIGICGGVRNDGKELLQVQPYSCSHTPQCNLEVATLFFWGVRQPRNYLKLLARSILQWASESAEKEPLHVHRR